MTSDEFETISAADLVQTTGGRQVPPSTVMGVGVNAMSLLDKPGRMLDTIRRGLGIPESGRPGDNYTPASANPDGSVTLGRFDTPRTPGLPEVPMSR